MKTWATAALAVIAVVALFLLVTDETLEKERQPSPTSAPAKPLRSIPVEPRLVVPGSPTAVSPAASDANTEAPSAGAPMMVAPSSIEELSARSERLQRCLKSRACEPGEMCGVNTSGVVGCFASNCVAGEPNTCGAGLGCMRVADGVFRCVSEGTLDKGSLCSSAFGVNAPAEQRCVAGFDCVAGKCTRGCEAGCGPDEVCEPAGSGAYCIPKGDLCHTTEDCGAGRWCWREDESSGLCVRPHPDPLGTGKSSCLPGTCGSGAECAGFVDGQLFRGECSRVCATSSDCRAAEACGPVALPRGARVCTETCDPFGTDCPFGKACFESLDGGAFCRAEADVDYAAANNAATMFTEAPVRTTP